MAMFYNDDLVIGKIPKRIKERTRKNMDIYCMGLSDSFTEAVRMYAKF